MRIRYAAAAALIAGLSLATASAASVTLTSTDLAQVQTCVISAYPSSTTAESNAWVGGNNGTGTSPLEVRSYATRSDLNRRLYISFDLAACTPAIPATATVTLATLRLYATAVPAADCRTQDIFAATSAWGEGSLTWSNQPFGPADNNPPSGSATAQMQVGQTCAVNNAAYAYVSGWNVTTDVQRFVSGTAANDGWMIRDDQEGDRTQEQATYAARGANIAGHAPQLVITYTVS